MQTKELLEAYERWAYTIGCELGRPPRSSEAFEAGWKQGNQAPRKFKIQTIHQALDNIKCLLGLAAALQSAGGVVLSYNELQQMSAAELIHLIAPNGIRFKYEGPTNDVTTDSKGDSTCT